MQPRERLTTKEMQVAGLVWEGLTNREIARAIGTTEQVVKNYLRNTFDKLGVWSRLELAIYVAAHGGSRGRKPVRLPQPRWRALRPSICARGSPGFSGPRTVKVQVLALDPQTAPAASHKPLQNNHLTNHARPFELLFLDGA